MALNLREREQCIFAGNFPEFLSTKIPKTTNPMHSHIHSSRLVSKAFLFAAALAASAVPALADGYYLSSGTDSVSEGETLTLSVDDGYKCYEAGILLGYDESDYNSDLNAFLSGVYAYEISSGRYEYCYESFTYLLGISGSAEFVNNGEITLTDGWWYNYYDEETGDEIYIDGYGAAIVSGDATFTNNGTVSCDDNNVYVVGNASFVNNGEILGACGIYLFGNATFTNSETGTVEVYEEIHVSENASFLNEGSLNVSYGIWLSGNGEFTNSSALDYAGIEFDIYAEDGSATFTNDGTIDEGDERISVCFNFWSWTEGEYFSESSSGTFVNNGTINGSVSVCFDYDTEGNSLAGTVSDYDWSGRMNFVNRRTISGSVDVDSYVAVTLVQGSKIGGNLTLGRSSYYYDDSGAGTAATRSVLTILLNSDGGSDALIDGDLILYTPTTLSVSIDSGSVVAESCTVQLFSGELILDTQMIYGWSEDEEEETSSKTKGSLTTTSGKFLYGDSVYSWTLDTETGELTATLVGTVSPLSYASMIAVPVAAFQNDVRTILSRTALGRYEKYDAGEDESGWEFFCQFQYTNLENDDADDTPTFDYELSGILAGADYRASPTLIVGLTAAGDSGDIDVHHSGGKIEVSDYRITVFASKLVADTIAVDCGLQLGYGDYEIKRKTAYGKVTGDAESRSVGAFVNAGTILVISSDKGLYAEPFVGVNVMHTSVNDFSEGGSGGMFKIDDFDRLTVEANVGVNFAWIFTLAGTTSRLGFGIAYTHEFEDEVDIDAALLGGTGDYEVTAAMFSSDRISLSPKIEIGLATGLSAYAGYTLDVGTDSSVAHSANIGVRAHF